MHGDDLIALVFVTGMLAGVFIIFLAMRQRSQHLEMQHRERLAMIERGHVPLEAARPGARPGANSRSMSMGIIVIGLGLALMTMISIAAESPGVGIGLGGAIVILGAAFVVRSLVVHPSAGYSRSASPAETRADESIPD